MHRNWITTTSTFLMLLLGSAALAEESKEHLKLLQQGQTLVHQKDYQHAYKHFHSLANGGSPTSQCIVGLMHQHGVGVTQDVKQAIYWFEKSAAQDFAEAQLQLGKIYMNGMSEAHDQQKGIYWLEKAASHDVAEAQYELGKFYLENGGPEKATEAKRLLSRSLRNGYSKASDLIAKLPQVSNSQPESDNPVNSALESVQQSWEGYADVAKELSAFNQQTSGTH
jgi:TPR repeat protein